VISFKEEIAKYEFETTKSQVPCVRSPSFLQDHLAVVKGSFQPERLAQGLESVSIRIQGVGYDVLEFLGVGTTFDIFQNILFPYSLNTAYCLSWIRRIGLVSFIVFGEYRHGYAVSSLMDTAYWLSE
ncbi:hypothetical protein Tco_0682046, partial [Tanacetum coccineum]